MTFQSQPFSKQKRWTSEEEIIKAIDKAKEQQRAYCAQGEKWAAESDAFAQLASNPKVPGEFVGGYIFKSKEANLESEKSFRLANRKDATLIRLKNLLAAFRTGVFDAITTDTAVV